MAGKVYKLWRVKRMTEAWYQLSKEEQDKLQKQDQTDLESVGGKLVLVCSSGWANEGNLGWGVEEYPSLEAALEYGEKQRRLDWARYFDGESSLGVPWED